MQADFNQNFKAIGITQKGDSSQLQILDYKLTDMRPRDLIVRIIAVSVNPVDYKKREHMGKPNLSAEDPLILGYDACGIVEEIGPEVKLFKKGDEVYYAGDLTRNGTNSKYQLIDERIVALKPKNLSFAESAALPLVTLTAWEAMIESMKIPQDPIKNKDKSILIIGGAGGVGSIAIPIAKVVLGLKVIATSSRKESREYCLSRGADFVIDYKGVLKTNLENIGFNGVDYVLCCSEFTSEYFNQMTDICHPCGSVSYITGLLEPMSLNFVNFFLKRISLHPEFMFTRSMYGWEMEKQGEILNNMKDLIEKGAIKTNVNVVKKFNLENLKEFHLDVERGTNIGKSVLENVDGFFENLK